MVVEGGGEEREEEENDVESGRYIRQRDERLGFSGNDWRKTWKDYKEMIMNYENE